MKSPEKLTPLLKQYYSIKNQHPDRILFFRMGDFYELFGDDAVIASSVLGLALTSRSHGDSGKVPLAGFPHHTLDRYLAKILKAGHKVAVCDQIEDPKKAKGIVKRGVTEVFTPGSITLDVALEEKKPNYLAAVNPRDGVVGSALLDISTGRFLVDEFEIDKLGDHLAFHAPSEIIVPESFKIEFGKTIRSYLPDISITSIDDYRFDSTLAANNLTSHFKTAGLDGFGLGDIGPALGAAGAVFTFMRDLKMGRVNQVTRIERINRDLTMELDSATIKNLELVETPYGGKKNSLLSVVDQTATSGGGRLLRKWLLSPLKDLKAIEDRQEAGLAILKSGSVRGEIGAALRGIPDLERLASKIAMRKAGPRDIVHLKTGLEKVTRLRQLSSGLNSSLIAASITDIVVFDDLVDLIGRALIDEPPIFLSDGRLFKQGFSTELDTLIKEIDKAKDFIHNLQTSEREKTGISSLKVGYNRVFGYYLEVTRPHLAKVPEYYIRKQTLVAGERFITEELKTKEELILKAEEKIKELESELYEKLLDDLNNWVADIQQSASAAAVIDILVGFAELADEPGSIMPEMTNDMDIDIIDGRHPVMERILPPGKFVPNNITLDGSGSRMAIITGPNMAGKSTYLRQVGLLVLMAQIGAPIPAGSARIGICDRIFTRVGASDDLLRGRSTFMVEMTEAASILNNATDKSLILLDELGRGTSTYDGLAIAWSLVEYLNAIPERRARTLFATHYHELIELADKTEGIVNLQVGVKRWEDTIVFLYKILPGGCDDSYGVQVAKLAGLPDRLLDRAREILARLEAGYSPDERDGSGTGNTAFQISLFSQEENRLRKFLKGIDPEKLTPIEALNILNKVKRLSEGND